MNLSKKNIKTITDESHGRFSFDLVEDIKRLLKIEKDTNNVIEINSQNIFNELTKRFETKNPHGTISTCYILRNTKITEGIYRISSDYIREGMPMNCQVVDSKRVCIECYFNGKWGYWMFSTIIGKVAKNSGFSSVERWLDKWSETKENFEYNKKYYLWLLKLKYPIREQERKILAKEIIGVSHK